jgi:hypothetical protein
VTQGDRFFVRIAGIKKPVEIELHAPDFRDSRASEIFAAFDVFTKDDVHVGGCGQEVLPSNVIKQMNKKSFPDVFGLIWKSASLVPCGTIAVDTDRCSEVTKNYSMIPLCCVVCHLVVASGRTRQVPLRFTETVWLR